MNELVAAGDDLADALARILDIYEIEGRLGKTKANKALKAWDRLRTQLAAVEEGDREPGDLPCPATGDAHDVIATPSRWFNHCAKCGESWKG